MNLEGALIISAFILVFTAIFIGAFLANRKSAARAEDLKQKSMMRGWTFTTGKERGYEVRTWSGVTDFVEWTAESLYKSGGHGHSATQRARWRVKSVKGPDAPILCMPVPAGKEIPSVQVAQGDGLIASLAKKAAGFAFDMAVDAHFGDDIGKEVDAKLLKPVPGEKVPGHVVMALDPDAATRVLANGLSRVLANEAANPNRTRSDQLIWVLLWKGGVALGKYGTIESIEDLDRLSRYGAAIARLSII